MQNYLLDKSKLFKSYTVSEFNDARLILADYLLDLEKRYTGTNVGLDNLLIISNKILLAFEELSLKDLENKERLRTIYNFYHERLTDG